MTADELLARYNTNAVDQEIKSVRLYSKDDYVAALRAHDENKQLLADIFMNTVPVMSKQ